jgi:hypothetical protein
LAEDWHAREYPQPFAIREKSPKNEKLRDFWRLRWSWDIATDNPKTIPLIHIALFQRYAKTASRLAPSVRRAAHDRSCEMGQSGMEKEETQTFRTKY